MSIPYGSWLARHKNYIFVGLILLLALKVIVPQLDGLRDSIAALKDANPYWILLAITVFFLGVPILTFQFMALALKPLQFGLTYQVQMAGLFVGKLLPSALGTISLNMYYFMKKQHTPSEATTVVTMNGLTSGIAYGFLMIVSLLASDLSLNGLTEAVSVPTNLIYFIGILLLGLIFVAYRSEKIRAFLRASWADMRTNLGTYKERPLDLVYALICNFTGSFTSLFAIYASAHAIGVDLSIAGAVLVYTFGNIAATLVPTPGGIGSAEAGLYAGLVLVGVDGPEAITITLLFRLITYWLPFLPGYYYFWNLRKSLLSDFNVKTKYNQAT